VRFLIIEALAADPVNGPHRHIDANYLYELFRLSICPSRGEVDTPLDVGVRRTRWQ
jgi:hypothetical protein